MSLSYRDLDLSTLEGAIALYLRLKEVARPAGQPEGEHLAHQTWMSCYRAAMADAVKRLNSPLLYALEDAHEARTARLLLGK
jgi:UrcA family protein